MACLALQSAFAAESNLVLTVDGATYSNVTFGTATPTSVNIFHSSGIASLPLAKLPPELQQKFGYDPQKVADIQKRKQEAAARARLKNLRRINGVIYDFSPAMTAEQEWEAYTESEAGRNDKGIESPVRMRLYKNYVRYCSYLLSATVVQVAKDGLLVRRMSMTDGSTSAIFLKNYAKQGSVIDGIPIHDFGMLAGRHTYTTVQGSSSTILSFDCGEPVKESELNGEIVPIAPQ